MLTFDLFNPSSHYHRCLVCVLTTPCLIRINDREREFSSSFEWRRKHEEVEIALCVVVAKMISEGEMCACACCLSGRDDSCLLAMKMWRGDRVSGRTRCQFRLWEEGRGEVEIPAAFWLIGLYCGQASMQMREISLTHHFSVCGQMPTQSLTIGLGLDDRS